MTEAQAWVAIAWLATIAIMIGPVWHAVLVFVVFTTFMILTLVGSQFVSRRRRS